MNGTSAMSTGLATLWRALRTPGRPGRLLRLKWMRLAIAGVAIGLATYGGPKTRAWRRYAEAESSRFRLLALGSRQEADRLPGPQSQ